MYHVEQTAECHERSTDLYERREQVALHCSVVVGNEPTHADAVITEGQDRLVQASFCRWASLGAAYHSCSKSKISDPA